MNVLVLAAGSIIDVRPGLIFWTIITFVLVFLVLRAKAWRPILTLVDEREKEIRNAIESAKRERAEAEKLLTEQKAAIGEARREAVEMQRKAQADMERFRDELKAKARAEAEALKAEAIKVIEDERGKALADLRREAAAMAIQIAERLIQKNLDDATHRKLAEDFVAQLPKGGVKAAAAAGG